MLFSPQIPLQLEPRRALSFEDFVPGPNAAVLDSLQGLLAGDGGSAFLQGPESCGKTHLLTALCLAAREQGQSAFYAGINRMPGDAAATLKGLDDMHLVCVDDVHLVAGQADWEESLFHCFNRLSRAGGRLVVASQVSLSALPLKLPDLASRLGWGLRLQLQAPDEVGKKEVVRHYARSLGIDLPKEVENYLVQRGKRDLKSLLGTVARMQQVIFASKRRMTIPLLREILRSDQAGGDKPGAS
jgi:DnaA family protein